MSIDGYDSSRIAVGAPGDDDSGADSGSAYVFNFDGTSWSQISKLGALDGQAGDRLGSSIVIDALLALAVVAGAPGDDDRGADSGSAYLFSAGGDQIRKYVALDGLPDDQFGTSVAYAARTIGWTLFNPFDPFGGGVYQGTLLAGAPGAGLVGSAYYMDHATRPVNSQNPTLNATLPEINCCFVNP